MFGWQTVFEDLDENLRWELLYCGRQGFVQVDSLCWLVMLDFHLHQGHLHVVNFEVKLNNLSLTVIYKFCDSS